MAVEATILIVEDDPQIRESLEDTLVAEGYAVCAVDNGAEALRVLGEGLTPGVILLDLMMPVMNGTEFRLKQLADPLLAPIPVIVVSAYPVAALHGPVLYLRKPVALMPLLDTIARALGTASDAV
jgi:CheY-like chemotaxis protein